VSGEVNGEVTCSRSHAGIERAEGSRKYCREDDFFGRVKVKRPEKNEMSLEW
jgi:hypothetical protein